MKHMIATVSFYAKHKGAHTFSKYDRATTMAVKKLEKLGYLKVNWNTFQAEHTGKVFV